MYIHVCMNMCEEGGGGRERERERKREIHNQYLI